MADMMQLDPKFGDINVLIQWARDRDIRSRCKLSLLLVQLYKLRRLRRWIVRACNRLEGGQYFSQSLRDILSVYHRVKVGRYSYGPCMEPGYLPPFTCVGNYCSIAEGIAVYRVNHTIDRISQHPFFFNSELGLLKRDDYLPLEENPLIIGHDVWIGRSAIILPKCRRIGDGAVVGAGSVITQDVAPFTVVAGNPAKAIRRRLPEDVERAVRDSEWWLRPLDQIVEYLPLFMAPVTADIVAALASCP